MGKKKAGQQQQSNVDKNTGSNANKSASKDKSSKDVSVGKSQEGKRKLTWSELLIDPDTVETLVSETPDLNRTASLYSRTDLYKCMSDFLSNLMVEVGFPENSIWVDVRLTLCLIASAIAGWSIAYYKFPKDADKIFWMVISFFIVAVAVAIVDAYKVGNDNYYVSSDPQGNTLLFGLSLDDFSDEVRLTVSGGAKQEPTVKSHQVSRYFDEEGFLVHENLFDDMCDVCDQHTNGQLLDMLEDAEEEGGRGGEIEMTETKKKK